MFGAERRHAQDVAGSVDNKPRAMALDQGALTTYDQVVVLRMNGDQHALAGYRATVDAVLRKSSSRTKYRLVRLLAPPALALSTFLILDHSTGLAGVLARASLGFAIFWLVATLLPPRIWERIGHPRQSGVTRARTVGLKDVDRLRNTYVRAMHATRPNGHQPPITELLSIVAALDAQQRHGLIERQRLAGPPLLEALRQRRREAIQRKLAASAAAEPEIHALAIVHDFLEASDLPREGWPAVHDAALAMIYCDVLTTAEFEMLFRPFQESVCL